MTESLPYQPPTDPEALHFPVEERKLTLGDYDPAVVAEWIDENPDDVALMDERYGSLSLPPELVEKQKASGLPWAALSRFGGLTEKDRTAIADARGVERAEAERQSDLLHHGLTERLKQIATSGRDPVKALQDGTFSTSKDDANLGEQSTDPEPLPQLDLFGPALIIPAVRGVADQELAGLTLPEADNAAELLQLVTEAHGATPDDLLRALATKYTASGHKSPEWLTEKQDELVHHILEIESRYQAALHSGAERDLDPKRVRAEFIKQLQAELSQ